MVAGGGIEDHGGDDRCRARAQDGHGPRASTGRDHRTHGVIVDKCHALGAPAAEAAIRKVKVDRWVGLTATPFRADGMDDIITMQCGPVRHQITTERQFPHLLTVHPTEFTTDEPGTDGASIQAIYGELATDPARNALIAADVADAHARGRHSIVLTNRVEHVDALATQLRERGLAPLVLHGKLSRADRDAARACTVPELVAPWGELRFLPLGG